MRLIGLAGAAGAGKDTAAEMLCERGWARVALADPMKRAVAEWFGFTRDQLWGPSVLRNAPDPRFPRRVPSFDDAGDAFEASRHGIPDPGRVDYLTPRRALQLLGTQMGRECYEDVWADLAIRTARRVLARDPDGAVWIYSYEFGLTRTPPDPLRPLPAGVAISDVRFDNEAEAIRAAGGIVVRLHRDGSGLQGEAGRHASEAGIRDDLVDVEVDNNGTLDDLRGQLDRVLERFDAAHAV